MSLQTGFSERGPWSLHWVRSIVVPLMLGLLLGALLLGPESWPGRFFFIAHFGLFIIWQPFVEGGRRLTPVATVVLLAALAAMVVALSYPLLLVWSLLLAGVVGGKVMLGGVGASSRWHYLLALAFLSLTLLLVATPAAFAAARLPEVVRLAVLAALGVIFVLMLLFPVRGDRVGNPGGEIIDFVNSVFVFLLLAVVVLGTLAAMLLLRQEYAVALFGTLMVLGALLLALGWAWDPRGRFSGLGEFVSRYLMSVGLPAEQWLRLLADHALQEADPDRFIERALADMGTQLRWLQALRWETKTSRGGSGDATGRQSVFRHGSLQVILYTRFPLSPALAWHLQLLVQLLAEFHADKLRSIQLKELSYLQAVHETGARLTHDIKNLLQSLQNLCHAVEAEDIDRSPELRSLLRRQLPLMASRLGSTLAKFQSVKESPATYASAASWWQTLRRQHDRGGWLTFEAEIAPNASELPVEVFATVIDNLLANVEEKRAADATLTAHVSLRALAEGAWLRVCDGGAPVPAEISGQLLVGPVPSVNGLGIGLLQCARLAATAGYRLSLVQNDPGQVCFLLAGPDQSGV